jgi:hypothetical protein
MTQVARAIGPGVDVREVLYTAIEREAMHANQNVRDPDALRATLGIRPELLNPSPTQVVLLDHVLYYQVQLHGLQGFVSGGVAGGSSLWDFDFADERGN